MSKEEEEVKVPENRKRKIEEVDTEEIETKKRKTCIKIYTDGGCSNNGRSGASAGIGVYFEGLAYEGLSERLYGKQTNNRAELTAIIRALEVVNGDDNILIHTDSEYSIKGISGVNKIKKNGDLFNELSRLIKKRKGETKFKKVRGHTGIVDGNFHADKLASDAINKYLL